MVEIKINQEKLFWWLIPGLITVELAVVMFDALVSEYGWVSSSTVQRFFNITREDGFPNFFSSFQLLTVAAVLLLITVVVRVQTLGAKSKLVWGWAIVAALFLYMGVDDATALHERVGTYFSEAVTNPDGGPDSGFFGQLYDKFPSYAWQFVFGPIVVVAGLFVVTFLLKQLPSTELKILILIAFGFFAVAMGIDFVEGMENEVTDRVAEFFSTYPARAVHFSKSVEEFLEMSGTTIFLFVFLKTLMSLTPSLKFEFHQNQ